MIGAESTLEAIAELICRQVELLASDDVACSILTLDDNRKLHTLAAPHLPVEYSQALDGIEIGNDVGSCGTAAYLGEDIVTLDLSTDRRWANYSHLTALLPMKACWSSPICAGTGAVIGTFAFYFKNSRGPSGYERELVACCTQLCAIAIEYAQTRERLVSLGYVDPLTKLQNRAAFHRDIEQLCQGTAPFTLLLLDLNNLKGTNDTLSHTAGDALICAVGERLKGLGPSLSPYRLGGDEFGVLAPKCDNDEDMAKCASTILEAVNRPVDFHGHTLSCYVTVGGVCSQPPISAEMVSQNADFALYHGKATRRGGFVRFEAGMRTAITRRLSTIALVDEALRDGRVLPFYQPMVKLETAEIVGLEALARVRNADGSIMAAADFHEAFGEPRVAQMLTDVMLNSVAADLRIWLDRGIPFQHVGLNVTTADFNRGDLDTRIAAAFGKQNVPLKHIVLEVNEAVFMGGTGDNTVATYVENLREKGIIVALDDFGTGYASLTHLLEFPVDLIKIDKSFVQKLRDDRGSQAIVNALIDIAAKLGMKIVAEGIDSGVQVEQLLAMGCKLGQGYHYSPPAPFAIVTELLDLFSQGVKRGARTTEDEKHNWPDRTGIPLRL
ncbi:EAL domain-containing protein [Corticibacterium sp. UT-5YL-CI-8]|nr:EAL domain-containing protein [Tianweitania sp. UT-5YL-CI-8]